MICDSCCCYCFFCKPMGRCSFTHPLRCSFSWPQADDRLPLSLLLPLHAGVLTYTHLGSFRVIKALLWPLAVILAASIIAARKHYTVDVVVAAYTVPMVYLLLNHYCFKHDQEDLGLALAEHTGTCSSPSSCCSCCGSTHGSKRSCCCSGGTGCSCSGCSKCSSVAWDEEQGVGGLQDVPQRTTCQCGHCIGGRDQQEEGGLQLAVLDAKKSCRKLWEHGGKESLRSSKVRGQGTLLGGARGIDR